MPSRAEKKQSGKAAGQNRKISLARQAALKALNQVFAGASLSAVQSRTIDVLQDSRDRGLASELVHGVLRWRWQLEYYVSQLLSKPLKAKENDVQLILLIALYELLECRTPDYAIINEAVELVRRTGKNWATSLVNAVLRRFTREKAPLVENIQDEQARYSHPRWLITAVKADWPDHWQQILQANNERPPFWLRVNRLHNTASRYRQQLAEHDMDAQLSAIADTAVRLGSGIDVHLLPGFDSGMVSVQDAGAQLTAGLMNITDTGHYRVLDLCAAPGGKTCHILERHGNIDYLLAVEVDEQRMQRIQQNLQRLRLTAELKVADARDYESWWDGQKFDRILIDAPCSGSGVIRRHPDIKSLRRASDIDQLVSLQAEILSSAWQMLADNGELLYVTCSILKDENQRQMQKFIARHSDALEINIAANWGQLCDYGRQFLPGEQDTDGFYFCRLKKIIKSANERE